MVLNQVIKQLMFKHLLPFLLLCACNLNAQDGIDIIQNDEHWKPCAYDTLIKDSLLFEAKAANKPLLLFFYGQNNVNCRKFILTCGFDLPLQKKIELYFYPIILDVNKPDKIPEIRNPFINGRRKTISYGLQFLAFQNRLLSSQTQPTFAVIDLQGNLVNTICLMQNWNSTRELFESFLIESHKLCR
jgi:hypothetical protein